MDRQKDGWMDGWKDRWTDPISQDHSSRGWGSKKMFHKVYKFEKAIAQYYLNILNVSENSEN